MEIAYDNHGYEKSPSNSQRSLSHAEIGCKNRGLEVEDVHVLQQTEENITDMKMVVESLDTSKTVESHANGSITEIVDIYGGIGHRGSGTAAITVRNGYKSYHKGTPVLQDFNMTVPSGTIYSLLGSSGCGKSTILSCCVGLRNLDKGDVLVFGHKPGSKESGVPGRRVGYMPQELSLYNELTIQEALNFYGRIYGMKRKEMFDSTDFLLDFLDLPKATRRVGSLSGGQKRRVSIAIALLHRPELLILDEPTVGVDPLLRESIWGHLAKLVATGTTTVIITTHYIEEARQSDTIGIMRNGKLLAEKSPEALISEFKATFLEDIVLMLCRIDREERKRNRQNESSNQGDSKTNFSLSSLLKRKSLPDSCESTEVEVGNIVGVRYESVAIDGKKTTDKSADTVFDESPKGKRVLKNDIAQVGLDHTLQTITRGHETSATLSNGLITQKGKFRKSNSGSPSAPIARLSALLIKNFIILMRNIGFLIFIFIVPAVQVILICLTIGADPSGLLLGVVNPEICDYEGPNWRNISQTCPATTNRILNTTEETTQGNLSCFYLAMLPEESFILEKEISVEKGLERIQKGYTYGYIQFPDEYTKNVMCRFGGDSTTCNSKRSEEIWSGSNILLELDMSNKQIGQTMKRIFVETYTRMIDRLKVNCLPGQAKDDTVDLIADVPYTFKKPVYGKDDTSFREFLAPSILLGLLFFFPLCSSGVSYITEKKAGTLDRALVAGVGTTELMGGFLISQVGILLGQAGFAFLILTQVFHIEILGSVSLALSLTILVGISGMSAGFLMAMFCTEEVHAVLLAIGTFFPNILLAGMVWPLEGMDRSLQYVSYLLPCTLACESMRSIISRGWTLAHRSVWPGFLSTFAWIIVYCGLSVIIHRVQRRI